MPQTAINSLTTQNILDEHIQSDSFVKEWWYYYHYLPLLT